MPITPGLALDAPRHPPDCAIWTLEFCPSLDQAAPDRPVTKEPIILTKGSPSAPWRCLVEQPIKAEVEA